MRHVPHTWGSGWCGGEFEVVIASDILLYCGVYVELVKTIKELVKTEEGMFVMSWNRRMEESKVFFRMMEEEGYTCEVREEEIDG